MHGFPCFIVSWGEWPKPNFKVFRRRDENQTVQELEKEAEDFRDQLKLEKGIDAEVTWA